MSENTPKVKILFFIGSLAAGGKERRLIELLTFLKEIGRFELLLIMTRDAVHFPDFYKLNIPLIIIKRKWESNDPTVFYEFYKICRHYRPHLIHTWGSVQTFYALPSVIGQRIPLVNSQITSAPLKSNSLSFTKIIDRINFRFSSVILSNSKAGIESYNPPEKKSRVIYNGLNMNRFVNLPDVELVKAKYKIATPYAVVMAATFNVLKDYDLFLNVARNVLQKRDDITFIGVGGYDRDSSEYERILSLCGHNEKILFPGRISDVESLINACTIGVLFCNRSLHGEGVPNSVLEYMALNKPVIVSESGGTKEAVYHNRNGYLITTRDEEEVAALIIGLIDNKEKRELFGRQGRKIIDENFSVDQMGKAFVQVYNNVINGAKN